MNVFSPHKILLDSVADGFKVAGVWYASIARSIARFRRDRRGQIHSALLLVCSRRRFRPLYPTDKDGQDGRDMSPRYTRDRTCRSCVHISVPVPGCSRPAMGSMTTPLHLLHLRRPRISSSREDTSIHPLRPPSALCGLTPLFFCTLPLHFAADYFGRVERIHYASVQFADFRDQRVGKG